MENKQRNTLLSFFLVLFSAISLTGCTDYSEYAPRKFQTDNEFLSFDYEVKDENNNIITSNTSSAAYTLKNGSRYKISLNMKIDVEDETADSRVTFNAIGTEDILFTEMEEANSIDYVIKDNKVLVNYVCDASRQYINASFTAFFDSISDVTNLNDVLTVHAVSTNSTYFNNYDYFSYTLSDYFKERNGSSNTTNYSYVLFGEAPQSVETDEHAILQLKRMTKNQANEKGYYEYKGNEYLKLIGSSTVSFCKVEPIVWRIIEEDDNMYTLMSEYILDHYIYKKHFTYNNGHKNVRLTFSETNRDKYKEYFTKNERKLIKGDDYYNPTASYLRSDELKIDLSTSESTLTGYAALMGVSTSCIYGYDRKNTDFVTGGSVGDGSWIHIAGHNYGGKYGHRPLLKVKKG